MAKENLLGQRFGRWLVINEAPNKNGRVAWHCKCDCGTEKDVVAYRLKSGGSQSCGCLNREILLQKNKKDLTDMYFGRLHVLYEAPQRSKAGKTMWVCQCDCGNIITVQGSNLTTGNTKSCGCYSRDITSITNAKCLEGKSQLTGLLTAIKPTTARNSRGSVIWKCKCRCGKECLVDATSFSTETTISCGCLTMSKGELKIKQLLESNNINFVMQKSFENCRFPDTGYMAKFDFFVNNKYCIEYDGDIHFFSKNSGWNTQEAFLRRQRKDKYKNQWCKEHNIPLIRIPYTHYDNLKIEDIILETSSFIV